MLTIIILVRCVIQNVEGFRGNHDIKNDGLIPNIYDTA